MEANKGLIVCDLHVSVTALPCGIVYIVLVISVSFIIFRGCH